MTGRHRPPPRLTVARVAVADGAVLAFGLTFAVATSVAPHARPPVTVAAPTAVDLREPTGHGGLGGPVAGPSFAADVPVWTEDKGAVIVDGQRLPRAATVTTAPRRATPVAQPAPTVEPVVTAAAEPTPTDGPAATATPDETPVVTTTDVTGPEVTEPTVTVGLPEITVAVLP